MIWNMISDQGTTSGLSSNTFIIRRMVSKFSKCPTINFTAANIAYFCGLSRRSAAVSMSC